MEEEENRDKNAEIFSESLFTYLWFTENLISGSTAAETVGEQSDFIADSAKAVVVLSALTVPSFNENMENFFKKNEMTRRSVFTFLTVNCFKNHEENKDDIFGVVLNTCTFVYRLVIFCQHRGHVEYIEFASMCWNEIYEVDIKEEFFANGGWDAFKIYVTQNRYVPKDKETDRRIFINFLEEINYLFPKLDINSKQRYTHVFSPAAALAELEAAATVGLLAGGLTPGSLKVFGRGNDLEGEAAATVGLLASGLTPGSLKVFGRGNDLQGEAAATVGLLASRLTPGSLKVFGRGNDLEGEVAATVSLLASGLAPDSLKVFGRGNDLEGEVAATVGLLASGLTPDSLKVFGRGNDLEGEVAATVGLLASGLTPDSLQVFGRVNDLEGEVAATVGLLASGLTPDSLKMFGRGNDLACEADPNDQTASCDQNNDEISDLLEDSDEELFQELVKVSLDSISKVHTEDPALDCIVCQTENGLRTTSRDDLVCPKHHPDSFYYLVTNPEEDNLCDENG